MNTKHHPTQQSEQQPDQTIEKTAPDHAETTSAPAKRKKCGWRKWLCAILGLLLALVLGLMALLSSGYGQRGLLKLADKWLDELKIEQVSGNLSDGLLLHNLGYHSQGISVSVAQARAQLQFSCLWQRRLCIDDVSLQQVNVGIDTALLPPSDESQPASSEMRRITLPLGIEVNNVSLSEVNTQVDNMHVALNRFQTALSLNNQQGLTIQPTEIQQLLVTMSGDKTQQATHETTQAENSTAPIDWQALQQQLTKPLFAELQQVILPFDIHLLGLHGRDWHYLEQRENGLNIAIPTVDLLADASGEQVQLQQLKINSDLLDLNGQGSITLAQDFPLNVQIDADIYPLLQNEVLLLPQSAVKLRLDGALKQTTVLQLETQGAADLQLDGQFQLNQANNPFQIHLTSPLLRYPFTDAEQTTGAPPPQVRLQNLDLQLHGDLAQYHIALSGQADGQDIPPANLQLNAQGTIADLQIQQLLVEAFKGKLDLQGNLAWRNGVTWQSAVKLDGIDTRDYLPEWKALLNGGLQTQGAVNGEQWQVQLSDVAINGRLNNQTLQLSGNLQSRNEQLLNADQLKLVYGNNTILLNGHIDQQSNLQADIDAPNLAGLLPQLSASLNGRINVQGSVQKPSADIDLISKNIDYQDFQLRNLSVKGKIDMDEIIAGALYLNLNSFQYGDIKLQQTKLIAEGNEKNHKLNLRTGGDPVSGTLNIYGSFDRASELWQGTLSQIRLNSPVGDWRNNQNLQLSFNAAKTEADISAHCWVNQQAQLCFPQPFKAGIQGDIPFELKQINLAMVNSFLEKNSQASGIVNGKGSVAWYSDKPFQLALALDSNELGFKQRIDYRTFQITLNNLNINSQIQDNNLTLKAQTDINRQGKLVTNLTIGDLATSRQLSGDIQLQRFNLNLLSQLLAKGESINGNINSNLKLGGNLQAPLLHGNFNLDSLRAKMYAMPFAISDGQLNLTFNGTNSTLNGVIKTPDSQLNLTGSASWRSLEQWQAQIAAQANRFRLDLPGIAKIDVSPNVEAKVTPQLLSLTGNVDVPWARIEIEELPESAVGNSSDLVIVDNKNRAAIRQALQTSTLQQQNGMLISSNIMLNIGNDVLLDAYGLKANLNGTLSVRQEKMLGLYGQVNIQNGRYASFGQDLLIRRGQISFSGLASQPFLNIEAIRNPEAMENSKVVAGIKVTGIAEQPDVVVFSEPGMSQDEALSYLLTGRGLSSSGDSASSASIGAAMLGLGLAKSGKLVGGIGEAFGISDLSLDTAGIGDSSQVVVSGNITPRLQVKYGVGLFQPLAELTLRYKILPQLYLQSVSGVNQAFDLLYQFEF
ncbi:translocation/assembly module TamB [Testudinibacter sp. TR-2022]|uniref:autotransporter assembly complex protein TamB n=1 Tax=Testudinibacter sp. TR-2022 TaxID=2585029 RepID=UPI001119603D|nr:translocation/assembly module TamB domain-containing protein [Testudinibacter sp. TR-2022]TNH05352.1 translocation/assembly module TamB [Pasteurellaceae bacterium Phil31]TNH11249.1 translocation/assembly module TamB [Testudinibacter sp. TR-2022]TNH11339.1 translocation/assembly module TamB [Testudinibacter sp. TR-2022]TNH14364.1 translocation/assembly module TamB [Testudinibacter sp. TR-2022]TNH20423.1 translocation/assembly module TamB [Testudinibacter sp. TR-2022]